MEVSRQLVEADSFHTPCVSWRSNSGPEAHKGLYLMNRLAARGL